jgi:glycerophosphoryl diester phosphodiesterase
LNGAGDPLLPAVRLFPGRRGPFVSAHRGFSAVSPENTLPALAAALAAGADIAEIDVRMTADHTLVLMHDADVARTTNGTGPISAMALNDVKTLDAGGWFGAEFAGVAVPTLDEVLEWSRGRLALIVELKNFPERDPAFLQEFVAAIHRHEAAAFVVPACFDHPTLADLHRRQPGWLLQMIVPCRLADPVHAAEAAGAQLVSLEPEFVVAEDVAALGAAGISVLTTVKSREDARMLFDNGVEFLESEDVTMARDAVDSLHRRP